MSLLVTGGVGFIGSNFVLDWLAQSDEPLINLDKLTYAGNIENLQSLNHDRRYAIDASKIERELGWKPAETFETGIRKTVEWYLDHQEWVSNVQSAAYREWVEKNYTGRTA